VKRRWIIDLTIVAGGFWAALLAPALAGFYGSGPLAILVALGLIALRLRAAGEDWAAIGLRAPPPLPRLLLGAVALYVAVIAAVSFIAGPLSRALDWPPQDLGRFSEVAGHPRRLAALLLLTWTSAAVGEEVVFRGFLQGRLRRLLGAAPVPTAIAIALQATLFGACHAYLGARGMLNAAIVGLVFGIGLVRSRGNLWPLILAHGLTDTVTLTLLYLGYQVS